MIFIISCEEVYYVMLKPNIQRKKMIWEKNQIAKEA